MEEGVIAGSPGAMIGSAAALGYALQKATELPNEGDSAGEQHVDLTDAKGRKHILESDSRGGRS